MSSSPPQSAPPFFQQRAVKKAIGRLAKARNLTIFVGAGVGTEIGLPTWPQLVRRLVSDAVAGSKGRAWRQPLTPANAEIVERLLERESLLSAATIAKARLGGRFQVALQRALYGTDWGDGTLYVPASGSEYRHLDSTTVEAVAAVYRAFSETAVGRWSCDILTTNYDLSLEEALGAVGIDAEPWFKDSEPEEGSGIEHVVRHLHGMMTSENRTDSVVLTEADYHEAGADKLSWQESYLRRRLSESTMVFVGTSLSDPDILSILFRSAEDRSRAVALLVERSLDAGAPDIPPPIDPCAETYAELSAERWASAGLEILHSDYVSQPRQFLWEVAMHKRDPGATPYGERLVDWYCTAAAEFPLALATRQEFIAAQDALSDYTAGALDQIRKFVREDGHASIDDESLAIHLWARSTLPLHIGAVEEPDLCAMAMIVCSDRAWRSPEAVDTRRIMLPTRRAALEAFCDRRVIERSHDGSDQWNYVIAIPIVLAADFNRLPVGAMTLASTSSGKDSLLARLSLEGREHVVDYLRGVAEGLLSN